MTILCFCGCGKKRPAFGKNGRPAMYLMGHGGLTAGKRPNYKATPKGTIV